jgi:hypothetical protein
MVNDPLAVRNADLRVWRDEFPGTSPIADARPRAKGVFVGVVHKIRLVPGRQLEVTVEDGTGHLVAIFTGRSNLPGLELGSGLRLAGTVASEHGSRRVLRNPTWTTVREPYQ